MTSPAAAIWPHLNKEAPEPREPQRRPTLAQSMWPGLSQKPSNGTESLLRWRNKLLKDWDAKQREQ